MPIERSHAYGAGLVVLISWLIVSSTFPSLRFLPVSFVLGVVATLVGLSVACIRTSQSTPRRVSARLCPSFIQPAAFLTTKADLNALSIYSPQPIIPAIPELSLRISAILSLLISSTVTCWFNAISPRSLFQNEIDNSLRTVLINLTIRLSDSAAPHWLDFCISQLIPLLTNHLSEFYTAERLIRGKNLSRDVAEGEELNDAIAKKCYDDGKLLHRIVQIQLQSEEKETEVEMKGALQAHLREKVERILPLVLGKDMQGSAAVMVMIREIVTGAVIAPAIVTLSDPDTWMKMLEENGGEILKDRRDIKKLRRALDEHAPAATNNKGSRRASRLSGDFTGMPRLRPEDDERQFERFIRSLRKTPTLAESKKRRNEIMMKQRKRSEVGDRISVKESVYIKRLEAGKKILDQRIAILSNAETIESKESEESTIVTIGGVKVPPRLAHSRLRNVLNSSHGLECFGEFMKRRDSELLLQFWISVEEHRDPLEELITPTVTLVSETNSRSVGQLLMDIQELHDNYLTKPGLRQYCTAELIAQVENYKKAGQITNHDEARRSILQLQSLIFDKMQELYLDDFKRSDLFYKWCIMEGDNASPTLSYSKENNEKENDKKDYGENENNEKRERSSRPISMINQRHSSAHGAMQKRFPELRRAVMSTTDLPTKSKLGLPTDLTRRSVDDDSARPSLFDDHVDDERLSRSVPSLLCAESDDDDFLDLFETSKQIVDAVQKELDDIVDHPGNVIPNASATRDNGQQDYLSDKKHVPSSLVEQHQEIKPSIASLGLVKDLPANGVFTDDLFTDDQPNHLSDEQSGSDGEGLPLENDIHEAAPGDLGLIEAIHALESEINRLVAQENIVDSLTMKAELTNNAAELRILKKSRQSLQREIRRKEMQKQQYVVQESDNSLYGKSAISIPSIMMGKDDDGHEFAIYVVNVRRQAVDNMPSASWTVARRYKEFHDLNKRLKARFEAVRELDFPSRQTLFTLQKDFLKKRRAILERYLRALLIIPAICKSRELRAFLSQSSIISSTPTDDVRETAMSQADLVTRIYNSVTDGMDDILNNLPAFDQMAFTGHNNLSTSASHFANINTSIPVSRSSAHSSPILTSPLSPRDFRPAEVNAEISALESASLSSQNKSTKRSSSSSSTTPVNSIDQPFIKPISDLFLELFELQKGTSWLRGRAVVVVLHQLLGGTVERKIRETVKNLIDEENLLKYTDVLQNLLSDMNKVKVIRTDVQKEKTRLEAGLVLEKLIPDLAASVVGRGNSTAASRKIAGVLGNRALNMHLVMTVVDEVLETMFPEISGRN